MKIYLVCCLFLAIIACGCSSNDSTGNTQSEITGTLKGKVKLYDSEGNHVADKSGVVVQAEGTSLSAISDTGGNWSITNLPTRTYSLSFTKAGYGTMKNTSYSFVGGGIVDYGLPVPLYQPIQFGVMLDAVAAPGESVFDSSHRVITEGMAGAIYGHLTGNVPSNIATIEVTAYVGLSPAIDFQDPTSYNTILRFSTYSNTLKQSDTETVMWFDSWKDIEYWDWMRKGQTIYVAAYPGMASGSGGGSYVDIQTGKTIACNPPIKSNTLSAIVR